MADKAVIDLRIYTIRPRAVQEYLKLYKKWALPVVTKHWGAPLGFFVTEVGPLNQVIHMWAFESCFTRTASTRRRFRAPLFLRCFLSLASRFGTKFLTDTFHNGVQTASVIRKPRCWG